MAKCAYCGAKEGATLYPDIENSKLVQLSETRLGLMCQYHISRGNTQDAPKRKAKEIHKDQMDMFADMEME